MLNPHVAKIHLPAHMLAAAAIAFLVWAPSLWAVVGFLLANFWYSCLGMSIGFHRYFTHRAFATSTFWRRVMLLGGTLAGQGSVLFWTALHRLHHPTSDRPGDVHSPVDGFWHSYMGWIFTLDPAKVSMARAADLIRDSWCRFTHRHYTSILWAYWLILLTIAIAAPVTQPFVAGVLIAGAWSIHQEALINSVCHHPLFGTRPSNTSDNSRDVSWLKWLTWGQSLHNTHHAYPQDANFGHHEFDPGYYIIKKIKYG